MSAHHRTAEWTRVTRIMRPRIAATLPAPCVNGCGKPVTPDQQWDVGHIVDAALGGTNDGTNLGPSHIRCNRAAGGRLGRAKQLNRERQTRRLPKW